MKYHKIIEAAICAPSGDNCQPWNFKIEDDRIHLFNLPDKDTSLFNFQQRASLVAHGAVLENILIASSALGYLAKFSCFPDAGNDNFIATITLEEAQPRDEPLYPFIKLRSTNRRRYLPSPLTAEERGAISSAAKTTGTGKVLVVEDDQRKKALSEVIGLNDQLVFENPHLHSFLFDHVRWTDEEALKTKDGLDIKTLELAPPDVFAFRLFRNYSLLQTLNIFGVSKIVGNNARKLAQSASAIGLITMPGTRPLDYLNAGRVLQRAWLESSRMELSFQMMTGITFLMQQVREGSTEKLSPGNVTVIKRAFDKIVTTCDLKDETLAVMFRIGHSDPPRARSLRLPVSNYL
jgi:nitroreductase